VSHVDIGLYLLPSRLKMYPLYQDASKVLELMEQRKGTANRLSLNSSIRNKKACLAIASETSRSVIVSMYAAMHLVQTSMF